MAFKRSCGAEEDYGETGLLSVEIVFQKKWSCPTSVWIEGYM